MIFTGGFLGNMSGVVASLVALPLAGIISFLLYQMGVGTGASSIAIFNPSNSSYQLRHVHRLSTSNLEPIDGNIPSCARDVFIELHKEGGKKNERACRGLLIRDDIIITTKECSKFNFKFNFAGVGTIQANPHSRLNSKEEMVDSPLGFLEAHPPYHWLFIHQPVRRTRMFLSERSTHRVNGTEARESLIMTCGHGDRPIAHNFPSEDGKMVPLVELAGVVPDDILWEARDLHKAPMLEYKSHRWWTRPITLGYEQRRIKEMLEEYDGPPGSMSIPWAHNDFLGRAGGLMEVVDPRGHRRDCFEGYYHRWQKEKPFSGAHFFDWLDFGQGKFLLETANETTRSGWSFPSYCEKKDFNSVTVHYFDDEMREAHEIYFEPSKDGKKLIARYKNDNELVPPSDMDDPHLYMWDLDKRWYMVDDGWDKEQYGVVKHTGVLAGMPALSGGKAYFGKDGALWGINFSSGHYRPGIQAAAMMYQWMENKGFNLTAFHWVGRDSWSTEECLEPDWEKIEIPGFSGKALNQSCHEITVNPTWMLKGDV